jgi:beta-galactosidase/beta-glucuronidase
MAQPHVIRLRGPWELEALARELPAGDGRPVRLGLDLPTACRVQVPGDWREPLGADFCGRARYLRRFNRPTNLDPHERVWLVLEGVDHRASVALNGLAVGVVEGYQAPCRFDITFLLEPHNGLAVEVSLPAAVFHDPALRPGRAGLAGGLIGEVRLEIGPGEPPR